MSDFAEIPGWPGYYVNNSGVVKSGYGEISANDKGKYSLKNRDSGKRRLFTLEQLLAMICNPPEQTAEAPDESEIEKLRRDYEEAQEGWGRAQDEFAALNRNLREMQKINRHNRAFNATLWSRLRKLEQSLPKLGNRKKAARISEEESWWTDKTCADDGWLEAPEL